jgi:hypothetical protein
MKYELQKYCEKVEITEFKSALEGHLQAIKIFVIAHLMILILIKLAPLEAMALGNVSWSFCDLPALIGFSIQKQKFLSCSKGYKPN